MKISLHDLRFGKRLQYIRALANCTVTITLEGKGTDPAPITLSRVTVYERWGRAVVESTAETYTRRQLRQARKRYHEMVDSLRKESKFHVLPDRN